jgi:hypothetical protein
MDYVIIDWELCVYKHLIAKWFSFNRKNTLKKYPYIFGYLVELCIKIWQIWKI